MKTDYKQSAVDRKDERHTVKPEEEFRPRNKDTRSPREVIIEYRWNPEKAPKWSSMFTTDGKWRKHKAYRNLKEAQHALENLTRKHASTLTWWEYRIKPEEPQDESST